MLEQERARLHPVPALPHTVAFGETRTVRGEHPDGVLRGRVSTRCRTGCSARRCGCGCTAPAGTNGWSSCTSVTAARSRSPGTRRAEPGSPQIDDAHFPPAPAGAINREPRAGNDAEAAFLGARRRRRVVVERGRRAGHLTDPGEDGARRVDREADQPGPGRLGARARRRPRNASARATWRRSWPRTSTRTTPAARQAGEDKSLTQGTAGWAALGATDHHRPRTPPPRRLTSRPRQAARLTTWRTTDDHHHRARTGRRRSGCRPRRRCPRTCTPCCAGCGCRTPGPPPPRCWPPPRAQRWEPVEVLRALFTEEVAGRDRSALATRRAAAAFPTGKTFDAWKPEASSIPAPTQQALRTLEWVHRKENLVVCGPSGTGKTFLLEALGQHAVEQGLHVAWFTLEDLGVLIRRHRADDTVTKAISPNPARRPGRRRRHRPAAGRRRRRRRPLPARRRRLRETLHRDLLEPAPRRVRRADAQNPGHRHRRPAAAPRPRLPNQRRIVRLVPSPRRQGVTPLT